MSTIGKYEIEEQIGKGGYGTVYKAIDTTLERTIALKVLHPHLMIDHSFIERFMIEARSLAKLDHENIITIFDAGESDGRIFIAMRYYPQGNLRDLLNERGSLDPETARKIILQIGSGLNEAHTKGMIHRDIKPENILFDNNGKAVIGDFGLTKILENSTSSFSQGGVGTPFYKAPELWRGKPAPSFATDIYSLGCVYAEMLTGKQIFAGDTPDMIITKHLIDGPEFPDNWTTIAAPKIVNLIDKCLRKDQNQRYRSISELFEELDDVSNKDSSVTPEKFKQISSTTVRNDYRTPIMNRSKDKISAGLTHTVGVLEDGKVLATGSNDEKQCQVQHWHNIRSISASQWHTVGLNNYGNVIATGANNYGQCDLNNWSAIVKVSAGSNHTVGLRSDGTVLAKGNNLFNQCEVSSWKNMIDVSAGGWQIMQQFFCKFKVRCPYWCSSHQYNIVYLSPNPR